MRSELRLRGRRSEKERNWNYYYCEVGGCFIREGRMEEMKDVQVDIC